MRKYVFPKNIEELLDDSYTRTEKGMKFEDFLFFYFKEEFHKVLQTSKYDVGVDFIIYKKENTDYRIGIQAKNFKNRKVTKKDIQAMNKETEDLYYLKEMRLFTTSYLNSYAKQYCRNIGIEYYEKDDIERMISEVNHFSEDKICDNDYKTELYNVRNTLMREFDKDKPHYIISYRTIKDLLDKKPKTIDDLYNVHGFGKYKVENYGKSIIEVFQNNI